jgi:dihydroorotate dehydrogenase (NAD+) catalytic subunit
MKPIDLAGISLKNPILTASGTFGYGDEFKDLMDVNSLGGIILKGLSLKPRQGNPTPRIAETPSGILNAIGLQNIGVDRFIKEKVPYLAKLKTVVVANVAGHSIEENAEILRALNPIKQVSFYEINVSCPNVKQGGLSLGSDPKILKRLVAALAKVTKKKLMIKLSPNVTDIVEMARICEGEGADMISAINTLLGIAIDIRKRKPVLANITGGLSGPAIKPVGVRAVWQITNAVKIPVVGLGGISTFRDALEYIMAGATALQVGTANFISTETCTKIIADLEHWMSENNIHDLSEIRGCAKSC